MPAKTEIKTEIRLIGRAAVDDRLEILRCDLDVFLNEKKQNDDKPYDPAVIFYGNMMESIAYHVRCLQGQVSCFKHPGGKGNVPVVFEPATQDIRDFVIEAWNLVATTIAALKRDGKWMHCAIPAIQYGKEDEAR